MIVFTNTVFILWRQSNFEYIFILQMSSKIQLTRNAIMYVSVGFSQQCLLQILSLHQTSQQNIQMVVYDGTVYAGALYQNPLNPQKENEFFYDLGHSKSQEEDSSFSLSRGSPKQLDVIKVHAQLVSKYQPLQLRHLKIQQTGISQVLGNQILSLDQYMKRRKFLPCLEVNKWEQWEEKQSKKTKLNPEKQSDQADSSDKIGMQLEEPQKDSIQMDKNDYFEKEKPLNEQQLLLQKEKINKSTEHSEQFNEKKNGGMMSNSRECRVLQNKQQQKNLQQSNEARIVNEQKDQENSKTQALNRKQEVIELLCDSDNQVTEVKPIKAEKSKFIDLLADNQESQLITQKYSNKRQKIDKRDYILISDLYERMLRFKILCRINFLGHFTSQKGNLCTKLNLVDEQGDQITCFLFQKANDRVANNSLQLLKGRSYTFQNGEIQKDQSGCLSITMPWSGIHQTNKKLHSFAPTKMKRVSEIEGIDSSHFLQKSVSCNNKSINNRRAYGKEIHVCGIFKGFKDSPKLFNNQFRILGILCDPQHEKAITFNLYVEQLASFPKEGAVISLHNMGVTEYQHTFRLQHTKRSYYLVENGSSHDYFRDLVQLSQTSSWKLRQLKNISEVTYVPRTIAEINQLLTKMIEQDQCYSELDCNIANVYEKKEFSACSVCHHETKPSKGAQAYCLHCKKIEKWAKRFLFGAQVADSTGSIEVTLFNEEIQAFVNMSQQEYSSMAKEERTSILELSSFQNILLKVRSQKFIGGSGHFVVKAEKISHKRGLEQIKEQSLERKTLFMNRW